MICEQNVRELWSIVQHMMDIPAMPSDSLVISRTSPSTQMAFVRQALKYLQQRLVIVGFSSAELRSIGLVID